MASSTDTLILLTARSVAVAQVQRGRVVNVREQMRDSNDLVQTVESALDLLSDRPKRTWILAADVWSQPVSIQADIARRVPAAQLAQFVCFEVEPLSGISPRQGMAGVTPLQQPVNGDPTYWVSEVDRTIFEQVESLVVSRGGTFGGLLHPAGAPSAIQGTTATRWRRVEVWPDTIVCLASQGKGIARHLIARDLMSDDWAVEARKWFDSHPSSEHDELLVVATDTAARRSNTLFPWREVTIPESNSFWLAAWAPAFPKAVGLPRISIVRKGLPEQTKRLMSLAATVLILVGCISAYQAVGAFNQRLLAAMREETESLKGPAKQVEEIRKEVTTLETQIRTTEASEVELVNAIQAYKNETLNQKRRIPEMLDVLAEACGNDVLLQGIESEGKEIKIVGRCLDARRANDVARELAIRLNPLGLYVELPDKSATYRLRDGAPHDFEFIIKDESERPKMNDLPPLP